MYLVKMCALVGQLTALFHNFINIIIIIIIGIINSIIYFIVQMD